MNDALLHVPFHYLHMSVFTWMSCAELKLHWSSYSVFLLSWKLAQRGLQRNRRRRRLLRLIGEGIWSIIYWPEQPQHLLVIALPGSNINRSLDSRCWPSTPVCTTPPKMKTFPPQLHAQCPSRSGKLRPTFTFFHVSWTLGISQSPSPRWLLHSPSIISCFIKTKL